ncbi:hypothetical protein ACJJTC_004413 [Scirpophaga incertulas]
MKNFLSKFHLYNFQYKGGYFLTMCKKLDKLSYYYVVCTITTYFSGMIFFNITPMYKNYKNGVFSNNITENYTLEFSVNYVLPGFDPKDHFIFTTIVNCWMSYGCSMFICFTDLCLYMMVFQVIGHMKVLKYNLEHLLPPKHNHSFIIQDYTIEIDMYDAQENQLVHEIICDCVRHHLLIVNFTDEISNFFGPMLALTYLYEFATCSLMLLECMQGNTEAIARYGLLTFISFGQLIQSSVIFEFIGSQSETLMDTVYLMPWECMNLRNRRTINMFLLRVQTPISLTAMGMVSVGVKTMLGILKTTLSYLAFLQTLK